MLYKLNFDSSNLIEPIPFHNLTELNRIEKDLENLIANNLLNNLFEDNALMLIYQQRQMQNEADIYALNAHGDLVIFELKRGIADDSAMIQILGYVQKAGQWSYEKINHYYKKLNPNCELSIAHQETFQLEHALHPAEFNRNQLLFVIGSAANEKLIKSITYWKLKGIPVEFIPYRIYNIGGQNYFEFFSKPYDIHPNPSETKGVILDTNASNNSDCIWDMVENNKAAAYGDQSRFAEYIKKNDFVFLSHKGVGLILGGKAKSNVKIRNEDEKFVEMEWLTPIPIRNQVIENYLRFSTVKNLLGHDFYWARTIKTPYLTIEESKILIAEMNGLNE